MKQRMFLLIICLLALFVSIVSFAATDSAIVLEYDFTKSTDGSYYGTFYCSEWGGVSKTADGLKSRAILMLNQNYQQYKLTFDFLYDRGKIESLSKAYTAIRQPAWYTVTGEELKLNTSDLGSGNSNARPGTKGIIIGMAGSSVEIAVHVADETSESGVGNIKAVYSLPQGADFTNGVEIEVVDAGTYIEIYAAGEKVAYIEITQHTEDDYATVVLKDNASSELARTEKGIVPEVGAAAFISKSGSYVLRKIAMTSLSGKSQDAIVTTPLINPDDIYLTNQSDSDSSSDNTDITNDKVSVTTKKSLITLEICIIIALDVALIGGAVICWVMMQKQTSKMAVSCVLVLIAVVGSILLLTGVIDLDKSQKQNGTNNPNSWQDSGSALNPLLDSDGNTAPIVLSTSNQQAQDAIGRNLPTYEEVGDPKSGKYVGVFYTLWTMDVNSLQDNRVNLARNPKNPTHGATGSFHWWAEPEVGYATSTDEWVVRRNLQYLALAGVDYIYLDFTNGYMYDEAFTVLLETSLKMREEGTHTPAIVPWAFAADTRGYGSNGKMLEDIGYIYRNYYSQEKYKSLWFYIDGKPLVLLKRVEEDVAQYTYPKTYFPVLYNEEIANFFTFRFAWVPSEHDGGHLPGEEVLRWSWCNPLFMHYAGEYAYGWSDTEGQAEQITIIAGGHCNPGDGRSGAAGTLDKFNEKETSGEGLYLQYQFDWAMEHHPEVEYLNISGWNEWVAQYSPSLITDTNHCPFGFVDAYNPEFSRDMEPMKGGYTDNYFYQLCSIIRQFKGMAAPAEQTGNMSVDISGSFDQWNNISGEYEDFYGDTAWRNSTDTTGTISYVNETGRNDILKSKVAYDAGYVYFYVETADDLTAHTDNNWMLLFIDGDNNPDTGWEGYDFAVNLEVIDENKTVLCAYQNGVWQEIGTVSYRYEGNKMHIAVPRSLIAQTGTDMTFGFHWIDNVTDIYDLTEWFLTGDSAPERRNQYAFKASCAYDESVANILQGREDGKIQYMPAKNDPGNLLSGLNMKLYTLSADYGKQPELYLLDGEGGNLKLENVVQSVSLPEKPGSTAYALCFEGYIKVDADGECKFTLTSDDGAVLYIDGRKVIDISGVHTAVTENGSILLEAGLHEIRIEYFENGNGNSRLSFECDYQSIAFLH